MSAPATQAERLRAKRRYAVLLAASWGVATLAVPALHLVGHEEDHVHLAGGGVLFVQGPEHAEHPHPSAHAKHAQGHAHPHAREHAHPHAHAEPPHRDAHAEPAHPHAREHAHPHAHAEHPHRDAQSEQDASPPREEGPSRPAQDPEAPQPPPLSFHGSGSSAHFGASLYARADPLVVAAGSLASQAPRTGSSDARPRARLATPGCRSRAPPSPARHFVDRSRADA